MSVSPQSKPLFARWPQPLRSVTFAYIWTGILCIAGIFVCMLIGLLVYRDTSAYQLYGNPWEPSRFPWHVIWPMRLMSIVGAMVVIPTVGGVLFVVFTGIMGKAFPVRDDAHPRNGVTAVAILLAAATEFLMAARLFGWFGWTGVPSK